MGATANDYQALDSVRIPVRVEVMYTYLCDQRGYNMQEVAQYVLGDRQEQAGKRVSSILRCYGFNGNNSARYQNRAQKQDIEDFVRMYPRGAAEGEFDRFLNQRLQQRKQQEDKRRQEEQEARRRQMAQKAEEQKRAHERQIALERQKKEEEERQQRLREEALRRQQEYERQQAILQARLEQFRSERKQAQALAAQGPSHGREAAALYEKLIADYQNLDYSSAGVTIGELYDEYGNFLFDWGLKETDPARKIQIYSKIPTRCSSYASAANNIGAAYLTDGFSGRDVSLAAKWFREAAENGSYRGAKNMADLLAAQDPKQALAYYRLSCRDPQIALQVRDIIRQLTKQLKEGELSSVSLFLRQHPEWFQVSAGSFPNWIEYAASQRLSPEKLWKKYQETNSRVLERQRFIFFSKKEYHYLGDLDLDDFIKACQEEWEHRLSVFGTAEYLCAPAELARVMDCHGRGMQMYREGKYEAAVTDLSLSASCANGETSEEAKRALFDIYACHLNQESRAMVIADALANPDADVCAYMVRCYSDKFAGDEDSFLAAANWLKQGGAALRQKEEALCQSVEAACEQRARAAAKISPDFARELLELIGKTSGPAMAEALFQKGRMAEAEDPKAANHLYERAAALGHQDAARHLAASLLATPAGLSRGLEILHQLAREGDERSAATLGEIYHQGTLVERNEKQSVSCFELCSDPGRFPQYISAAFALAFEAGKAEDFKTTLHYYTVAAQAGDARAQNNLGAMYMRGQGVPIDENEGEHWYRLAAAKKNGHAAANLGRYLKRKHLLTEAKEYLEMAKALGRDVEEDLEAVNRQIALQKRSKELKDQFYEYFHSGDFDQALDILGQYYLEFPGDSFYNDMLIPCLEEGDEDMDENKKHETLAAHYVGRGYIDLAWDHYKLARQLELEAEPAELDFWALSFDEEDKSQSDLTTWHLDFMELLLDSDEADYDTCQSAFAQCCTLDDLAARDDFGNPDTEKRLANYRRYADLKIQIAWKHKRYEECGKWLAERYTFKGTDYSCPVEYGILQNLQDQKLKDRISLYADAWEAYETFLSQNQMEDPDETLILEQYLSTKFQDSCFQFHSTTTDPNPRAQQKTLAMLMALTKNRNILEKLYQSYLAESSGHTKETSANAFVGRALYESFPYNTETTNRRHLKHYLSGQVPPKLSYWLYCEPWIDFFHNGIEDFASDLRRGDSSRWGEALDNEDVWEELDSPEYKHILDALGDMLSRETDLSLKEKDYPRAAAILRALNLGDWGGRYETLRETLRAALEGTQWYHELNDAIKGGECWKHKDDPRAAAEAVVRFEKYIEARQTVRAQEAQAQAMAEAADDSQSEDLQSENSQLEDDWNAFDLDFNFVTPYHQDENWEADRLSLATRIWDKESLSCLIQAYLKGEGAAQSFSKVRQYYQLYMDWGFGDQSSALWIQLCEVLENSVKTQSGERQRVEIQPAGMRSAETPTAGTQTVDTATTSTPPARPAPAIKSIDGEVSRPLSEGLRKGEKALALRMDGQDSRTAAGVKTFTAAMKWILEQECAKNPGGRAKLEQILTYRNGKKLPGGLPVRFFSPMLSEEEQEGYTIPSASIKQIEGTDLVLLFHYSSDMLCEILINVLRYMDADLERFQLVLDAE